MKQHCIGAESVLGTHSNDWIFSRAIKKLKIVKLEAFYRGERK